MDYRSPIAPFEAATIAFWIRTSPIQWVVAGTPPVLAGRPRRDSRVRHATMPVVSGSAFIRAVLPRRPAHRGTDAYEYLPASALSFPSGEGFVNILREAGFSTVRSVPLVFGAVYLYIAGALKATPGIRRWPVPVAADTSRYTF